MIDRIASKSNESAQLVFGFLNANKGTASLREYLSSADCDLTSMIDAHGRSPLHVAAENDSLDAADILIRHVKAR
jgi:ankyrin repeat protein